MRASKGRGDNAAVGREHVVEVSREAASKLAEERQFEQGEDQFFASRRITERFDLVFIILGAAVLAACVWGALVGAFA